MKTHPLSAAHRIADDLEKALGDPLDERHTGPFSYRSIVEAEERDELPAGSVDTLRRWGFPHYLVPRPFGGRMDDLEELLLLTRTVSRRNMTCAVMYGSALLAVNPVWLWGDPRQRKAVADGVMDGDLACFGVSEVDHGSDVLSSETTAEQADGHLLLTGTKWPVGNATRGRFVTTYAKSGPMAFSLVLVDKNELAREQWTALPYVKTVGLRGHDLSGIAFSAARLPADSIIGRPGSGLVQTLKTLQITRTAIAALSLGTMDAALRIGLDYTRRRALYGAEIYQIPIIRDEILKAHIDLLIAECTAVPVARSLTIAPGRLSLWSSVVKYFVPTLGEEVVATIGRVLAARGYLREGVAWGAFQKLQRDHAIASVFEGTVHVNLANIASQLPHIVADAPPAEPAAGLFTWTRDAPRWEPDGTALQLTNEGCDEITQGYPWIAADVLAAAKARVPERVAADLTEQLRRIDRLHADLREAIRAAGDDTSSAAALGRARRHCELQAMVSCLLTWLHNHEEFGGAFATGEWLVLCLQRLLQRSMPEYPLSPEHRATVERAILDAGADGRWFSLLALADD